MGTTPPVKSGSVRGEARANAARRERFGDLVHLTGIKGRVKVKRAGQFAEEVVGSEGTTLNADDQIIVTKGASVSLTSDRGGTRTLSGGGGQILAFAGAGRDTQGKRKEIPLRSNTGLVQATLRKQ